MGCSGCLAMLADVLIACASGFVDRFSQRLGFFALVLAVFFFRSILVGIYNSFKFSPEESFETSIVLASCFN